MKKVMQAFLILAVAFIFTASSANAAPTASPSNSYISTTATSSNHVRVRYFTRRVRYGRFIYRETYRVSIFRNGRVYTQLIDRDKIGRIDDFDRY